MRLQAVRRDLEHRAQVRDRGSEGGKRENKIRLQFKRGLLKLIKRNYWHYNIPFYLVFASGVGFPLFPEIFFIITQ